MKKILIVLISCITLTGIQAQKAFQSDKLTKKWEVSQGLKVPESVYYDALHDAIYISNISGSSREKDNEGFITKLSADGKVTNLNWVTGLNAPKGMGAMGRLLYVSDIDRVAEIDIASGKINRMIDIPGSVFLNDITIDGQGNVYVSDSEKSTIHVIRFGNAELFLYSEKLKGVNGLFFSDGKLLAGVQDRIVSIDPATKAITDFIPNTGNIDGLVSDGNGNFLISDWKGNVHLVAEGKEKVKLLDTTPVNENAADIEFIPSKNLLLVPTFSDNKVVAYELK
jgi:sugar lactone lactonase YvrE